MAKVSLKSYFEPTPVNIRKFADSLLIAAVFIQTQPDLLGSVPTRWLTISIIVAKVVSNFFSTSSEVTDGPAQ